MYNAPYSKVADHLASFGRYGDSELVHLNPIEVQMLASLSPTGQLTVNPITGRKEAFLPFLAPLLGSFLGNAALGSTLAGALGSKALGAAAASALGSAAATTAVTGDLEQGIMSGITGFGIGSALGSLGQAGTELAKETVNQGAQAATAASNLTSAAPNIATAAPTVAEGFGAAVNPIADTFATAAPNIADIAPEIAEGFSAAAGNAGTVAGRVLPQPSTFGQRLIEPLRQPGDLFKQLAEPGSFLPVYVGETGRMAREQELMGRGSARAYEEEQEKERARIRGQMGDVFNAVRGAYPGVGYSRGGIVERYFDGGDIESQVREAMNRSAFADIPAAKDIQLSLRGQYALTPPKASYSALDVGGEGYMPGVAPEFKYFTDIDPNKPPPETTTGPDAGVAPGSGAPGTGPGPVAGGGFNLEDFLSGFGGYQRFFGGAKNFEPGMIAKPETPDSVIDDRMPRIIEDEPMYAGGTKGFDESTGNYVDTGALDDFINANLGQNAQPTTPAAPIPDVPAPESIEDILGQFRRISEPAPQTFAPPTAEFLEQYLPTAPEVPQAPRREEIMRAAVEPQSPVIEQQFPEIQEPMVSRAPRFEPPAAMPEPRFEPPVAMPAPRFEQAPAVEPSIPEGFRLGHLGNLKPIVSRPAESASPFPQFEPPAVMPQPSFEPPQVSMPEPRFEPPVAMPAPRFEPPPMAMPEPRFESPRAEMPEPRFQPPVAMPPQVAVPPVSLEQYPDIDPEILQRLAMIEEMSGVSPQAPAAEFAMSDEDFGRFAEGGMTPMAEDMGGSENDLISMTISAIRGEAENADQIIRAFVEQYGPEIFMQLRDQILQEIVPGAQTEGMIEGEGGGQDDLVEGMIGTQRPVAVSPGEYIIPADAVALAGGGYSGDGAKFFDGLVDDIRKKTMGTTEQVRPYRRSA
jgi:hypothetical protein